MKGFESDLFTVGEIFGEISGSGRGGLSPDLIRIGLISASIYRDRTLVFAGFGLIIYFKQS